MPVKRTRPKDHVYRTFHRECRFLYHSGYQTTVRCKLKLMLTLTSRLSRTLAFYPLAVDPCFIRDPLLHLLPRYGHATIFCTSVVGRESPSPTMVEEASATHTKSPASATGSHPQNRSSESCQSDGRTYNSYDMAHVDANDGDANESDGDVDAEMDIESDSAPSVHNDREMSVGEYFAGEWMKESEEGTETSFYHNRGAHDSSGDGTLVSQSQPLDYRFFSRLTVDISEEGTPVALLCLATHAEIYDVICSSLFQRRSWGILDPIIGVAFDSTSSNIRIISGWFDSAESDCVRSISSLPLYDLISGQPSVYVGSADECIYDLSDPQAARRFTHWLWVQAENWVNIARTAGSECQPSIRVQPLPWRIDQAALFSTTETDSDSRDARFQSWHDSLAACQPEQDDEYCGSDSASASSEVLETVEPCVLGLCLGSSTNTSPRPRALLDENTSIKYYMFPRGALVRSLLMPEMLAGPDPAFERHFLKVNEIYFALTSFCWIDPSVSRPPRLRVQFTEQFPRIKIIRCSHSTR